MRMSPCPTCKSKITKFFCKHCNLCWNNWKPTSDSRSDRHSPGASESEPTNDLENNRHDEETAASPGSCFTVIDYKVICKKLIQVLGKLKHVDPLLMICAEAGFCVVEAGRLDRNTPMMPNARILFYTAWTNCVVGFICCLYGALLQRVKPVWADPIGGLGTVAAVVAFLALMCMRLNENINLYIAGALTCVAFLPAFAL